MIAPELRTLAAQTIRALAIDATNAANSGHPGAPMGLADIAVVLWADVMRFDPEDPAWPDRDRFVLSNGHASMLLYSMLHLSGYALPIEELRRFRQLGSKTPGHPEHGLAPGVETTTGPLGQGFANAVGMAIGARMAKARFNGRGFDPVTHHVFGILGDGCMMEGITSEAASLAGHLGLAELVFVYDDNRITIDGSTDLSFSEDVRRRFEAYGWHTLEVDGHDPAAVRQALEAGRAEVERPTLIRARTHIGFGSPNRQDSAKVHGEPLGEEEARLTKERLGWRRPVFEVPEEVRALFASAAERGRGAHRAWRERLGSWRAENRDLSELWDACWARRPDPGLSRAALEAVSGGNDATRGLSAKVLNAIAARMPALVGGSADLAVSNKSTIKGSGHLDRRDFSGRNIHFGVREHAMAAITNGLALHGAFVPYAATFLAFSDYMRPSVRLSALMRTRSLFVYTHDSIGLGEDGPTHQPVEHLGALRLIPRLTVWRPADGVETAMAWSYAVAEGKDGPHALVFTRQKVPALARPEGFDPRDVWKGAYVLLDAENAEAAIIATGSEVGLALDAALLLKREGLPLRVVSMPSMERFFEQDEAYQERVLPRSLPRASLEAGRTSCWRVLTGLEGLSLGVDDFGESAPYEEVYAHFGLTPEKVALRVRDWLRSASRTPRATPSRRA